MPGDRVRKQKIPRGVEVIYGRCLGRVFEAISVEFWPLNLPNLQIIHHVMLKAWCPTVSSRKLCHSIRLIAVGFFVLPESRIKRLIRNRL